MSTAADGVPRWSFEDALAILRTHFGMNGSLASLPSYSDQNFRVDGADGERYVLRVSNATRRSSSLEAQLAALEHLGCRAVAAAVPRVAPTSAGDLMVTARGPDGTRHHVHLLRFLEGTPLAEAQAAEIDTEIDAGPPVVDRELLTSIGRLVAEVDRGLTDFEHPGALRDLDWDLTNAPRLRDRTSAITPTRRRWLAESAFDRFARDVVPMRDSLPTGTVHNDANEHNLLVSRAEHGGWIASGLIDFGDLVSTHRVFGLAIAAAYGSFGHTRPFDAVRAIVAGYHATWPLEPREIRVLLAAVRARLATTVTQSAFRRRERPENAEYLGISERAAWASLERLAGLDDDVARATLEADCGGRSASEAESADAAQGGPDASAARIRAVRARHLGPNLSLAYRQPLEIVRGYMQYLYDPAGRPYLDCVNNVCHVGHGHPRVVEAIRRQAERLNTNTRYLHRHLADYAERLTATLPSPLEVCFFVCTGSEANDLALRLARAYTGHRGVVTVDGAYHGHTGDLIEISPYKFDGEGGAGAPDHVAVASMPDAYRFGRAIESGAHGRVFGADVERAAADLESRGHGVAAFISESLLGCGGQVVPADGYFRHAFAHARARGAVCILDEVQVGFGRVGDAFWAFEPMGVVPDIVTLGKPIGNGHPMAAVITTRAIADAFDTGMEYFNTFGGNPVSMAAGLAVLDVIEDEGLQEHAARVGRRLIARFESLAARHALIGDVRGRGLFLGIELVHDRDTLRPAADAASAVVEGMKARGVLLSTDGPLHNVIKIKPPLPFAPENADELIAGLDRVLGAVGSDA